MYMTHMYIVRIPPQSSALQVPATEVPSRRSALSVCPCKVQKGDIHFTEWAGMSNSNSNSKNNQ